MAALTAGRDTKKMGFTAIADAYEPPVKNAVRLFAGGIAVLSAGYCAPAVTGTNLIAMGRIEKDYDLSTSDGQFKVKVFPGIFLVSNSTGGDLITQADAGKDCYLVDDQTVAKTDGGGTRSRGGKIIGLEGSQVWVQFGLGV